AISFCDDLSKGRIRVRMLIRIIQPIHIAHDDEKVCVYKFRHYGSKRVILSEFRAVSRFIHRNCIIFIDDGYYILVQKRIDGCVTISIRVGVVDDIPRHEYLADILFIVLEKSAVKVHQGALTDGGKRLLFSNGTRILFHFERTRPYPDSPGRYQYYFFSLLLQR